MHKPAKVIQTMSKEPKCPQIPFIHEVHGHQRLDNYKWLNERDTQPVLNYIEDENTYQERYFKQTSALQDKLLQEFEQRIDPNDKSAPFQVDGDWFQIRNQANFDYGFIDQIEDEKRSIYFNENERAAGQSYYALADWLPSPNKKLLAISEDTIGRRNYTIQIRDNITNNYLSDKIEGTDGTIVWSNDNSTLFYIRKDPETLREFQVYKHKLGTSPQEDQLIFEEKDERFYVQIGKTITNSFIEIQSTSSTSSETWLLDAYHIDSELICFLPRIDQHLYTVFHHETGFYFLSNYEAKNNKLCFSEKELKSLENIQTIEEHNVNVYIENALVLKNNIILELREQGLQQLKLITINNKQTQLIQLQEETYYLSLAYNDNYEAEAFYYVYNSLTTPSSVYKYNLSNHNCELFFQKNVPDQAFSPNDFTSKRIWFTANDGTEVPICLVYKTGIDTSVCPLLLYGYGSYGITYPDIFNPKRLSLLERGFVFAIAHIRGERYLGEEWYESGKFLKKKNTFTDFINAAEHLGQFGYCHPEKIYAQGGSAGGLLMGAVMNMAPYLWKGIVAQVPFVDVVTTMLDDTLPLTVGEYEEWGNPNELTYYNYMLSYSPYDNIKKMKYPSIFVSTGYHDSQVQYWEPLKWVAKLREYKTTDSLLLFDCNMHAGHGGGSGRTNERKEIAKTYAFILSLEEIID
jgi:oligopeptidase B